jgi:hypothetical protein
MHDGEIECDAETFSDFARYLYANIAPLMDTAQRGDFRRETERLWQAALLEQQ